MLKRLKKLPVWRLVNILNWCRRYGRVRLCTLWLAVWHRVSRLRLNLAVRASVRIVVNRYLVGVRILLTILLSVVFKVIVGCVRLITRLIRMRRCRRLTVRLT